jgi:hypothetical protein
MATAKPARRKRNDSRLTFEAKAVLRRGSHAAVVERLTSLSSTLQTGRWLPEANFYVTDTIRKLQDFGKKKKSPKLRQRAMVEYVAVSAPLHSADGWSFLGRAIAAVIAGDANAARHLAYYAELRAAMSLMASEGVGIFNNSHFVVYDARHCRHVPTTHATHKFTWDCIKHWAELRRATQPLMEVVRPGNVPVREWLDQFISSHSTALAARWLSFWGIDLRSFPEDREARNEASYRPTALRHKDGLSADERSEFIENFWSLCEPTQPSRFGNLDRYILRDSVREIYKITTGYAWDSQLPDFGRHCERMIHAIAPSGLSESNWLAFLTGTASPDRPLLLREADDRQSDVADPRHHLKVIARAALLLRLATGAAADLLERCDASAETLKFWWEAIGREAGLWRASGPPDDLTDLWVDIEEAIITNREWLSATSDRSIGAWVASGAAGLHTLGSCERIALWGLGL